MSVLDCPGDSVKNQTLPNNDSEETPDSTLMAESFSSKLPLDPKPVPFNFLTINTPKINPFEF